MLQTNDVFPVPRMATVGRQTPQLCARKVGHNEARSNSHTFGKDELNLGIAQSPSTRRVEPNPAPHDHNSGTSSMRRDDRPALRVQPLGAVSRLVGIEGGVVSGVINLESSGVEASDW